MKILLPTDGSKFSQAALDQAIRQFRPEKAEICALHVIEPLLLVSNVREGDIERIKAAEQRLWERGKELVARAEGQLVGAGFKTSTALEQGDPRAVVVDFAAHWKADLILIGSHGRTGLSRFLMGSVAEYISRHAHCSVEIVRIAATAPSR